MNKNPDAYAMQSARPFLAMVAASVLFTALGKLLSVVDDAGVELPEVQ